MNEFALFNLLLFLPPYLFGSIPFGLLLAKLFLKQDIRKSGSGNIGTTNVLRAGGKKLALLTLLLDSGKGAVAIFVFYVFFDWPTYPAPGYGLFEHLFWGGRYCDHANILCEPENVPMGDDVAVFALIGLYAVLGHCFPVWLKFKGGKGVATALGVLLAAVPYAGLAACAAWLLTAFAFRISSLAALIALGVAPIVTLFIYGTAPAVICALITLLVWIRHKDNIKRLLKGEEPKIGAGKKKEEHAQSVSK